MKGVLMTDSLIRYLRGFLVVTLTVLLAGPVPAVLYALTEMQYVVLPFAP